MTVFRQSAASTSSASFFGKHDPLAVLEAFPSKLPLYLLHSGRHHQTWANRSILGSPICVYQFHAEPESALPTGKSRLINLDRRYQDQISLPALTDDPITDLKAIFKMPGRWIGYIGYELGQFLEPRGLRHKPPEDWPVIELGYCPVLHEYDLGTKTWQRWQAAGNNELPWEMHAKQAMDISPKRAATHVSARFSPLKAMPRESFEDQVRQIKAYIAAGDIFQANLSQRFETTATLDYVATHHFKRQLAQHLFEDAKPWYGSYFDLLDSTTETPRRTLISSSPELFLQTEQTTILPAPGQSGSCSHGTSVITRPIKGTAPNDDRKDRKAQLLKSDKDQAELNMIVDLMRNDIGRICDPGTVMVLNHREIESHPTVHHGVATIRGRMKQQRSTVDLIAATMPGGSITGAPKIRAMEIIDELESHARGPYTGITGIFSEFGQQSAINIRQLQLTELDHTRFTISFYVGAGIVSDSIPAKEYEETITKSRAMRMALSKMNISSEGLSLG